ncbi:FecR family protein [Gluconacetobacter sp. Hr-1-5]|uniref:FecR family protein n=1 Tax=Gluconacetobacter sp. Hr-1-5 TaxID=3395370 RepID=UPI003B52F9C1
MPDSPGGKDRPRTPRRLALSDEAIAWLTTLCSGRATEDDRRAFARWRARSPAHEEAAQEAERLFGQIGETAAAQEYRTVGTALAPPPYQLRARRFGRRAFGASLAAGATAWAFGPAAVSTLTAAMATYHTSVGERRRVALEDGSHVWLNTATAISVAFTGQERRIALHDGEALFDVIHDAARPFVVTANGGQAEAQRTIYGVRRIGSATEVAVQAGMVAVRDGTDAQRVTTGQMVRYDHGIVSAPASINVNDMTSWTRGKLIFNRENLETVARELERYQRGRIVVVGDRLRKLQVTGVFDIDDKTALLSALQSSTGARVTHLPYLLLIS